jgi:hypothetical protein
MVGERGTRDCWDKELVERKELDHRDKPHHHNSLTATCQLGPSGNGEQESAGTEE